MTSSGARADFLLDLMKLIAFYETYEDVPVPERTTFTHYVLEGGDRDCRAEVDRVATALGVEARWRNGYYIASRSFGPVTYEAIFCPHLPENRQLRVTLLPGTPAEPVRAEAEVRDGPR